MKMENCVQRILLVAARQRTSMTIMLREGFSNEYDGNGESSAEGKHITTLFFLMTILHQSNTI